MMRGLDLEPGLEFRVGKQGGVQQFDRHHPPEGHIGGPPHLAHAAGGDEGVQPGTARRARLWSAARPTTAHPPPAVRRSDVGYFDGCGTLQWIFGLTPM